VAILVLAVAVRLAIGSALLDDAYITFRYAEHLAEGLGFVYNPGAPVLGTSTPLFTLWLAGAAWLGLDVPSTAVATGILAMSGLALLLFFLLDRTGRPGAGLVAASLVSFLPTMVLTSVSGMETAPYMLLTLSAVAAIEAQKFRLGGALCAAVTLIRPEGILLVAVLGAMLVYRRQSPGAVAFWLFVLPVAAWNLFAIAVFGSPIPSSVTAKAAAAGGRWIDSLATWWQFLTGSPEHLVLFGSAVVGLFALRHRWSWVGPWLAWAGIYSAAFIATDAFHHYPWYFSPLLPPVATLASIGMDSIVRAAARTVPWLRRLLRPPTWAFGAAACLCTLLAAHLPSLRADVLRQQSAREALYRQIGQQITIREGRSALVAATEIGALGSKYPGPILDLVGLVSPEMIGLGHAEAIRRFSPAWIVSYDTHLEIEGAPRSLHGYCLAAERPVGADRSLLVFRIGQPTGSRGFCPKRRRIELTNEEADGSVPASVVRTQRPTPANAAPVNATDSKESP